MTLANRPIGPVDAPGGQLLVSPQGLGCMSMSIVYGAGEDERGIATIHRALDLGVAPARHRRPLRRPHQRGARRARPIAGRRDEVTLATKFGIVSDAGDPHRPRA